MSSINQINKSGFPLQLALADLIRRTGTDWRVLYEEHAWEHSRGSGFLDLVIENEHKTWLMNIECKRVIDADWVFIREQDSPENRRNAKLLVTMLDSAGNPVFSGWKDMPMDPPSVESAICIVPGEERRGRPMLERTAAQVVISTEALATEEASLLSANYSALRIYQNVLVTTACLKVATVDPTKIDLKDGRVAEGTPVYEVPYVRFRKQLGSTNTTSIEIVYGRDIAQLVSSKESTVFVVNARHFLTFLSSCELPDKISAP